MMRHAVGVDPPDLTASEGSGGDASAGRGRTILRIALTAMALIALAAAVRLLPVAEWIEGLQRVVEGLGPIGWIVFAAIYVLATVLFIPGSLITLAGGAIYGPLIGTVVVSVGSTIGAAFAFLLARYFLRDRVVSWTEGDPRFATLDQAIGRRGGWIVFLVRLSPVFPFNTVNYAFGLTGVSFWSYLLNSWIGMLPGTLAYVWIGAAGRSALVGGEKLAANLIGAMATLIVTIIVTRIARRAIADAGVSADQADAA